MNNLFGIRDQIIYTKIFLQPIRRYRSVMQGEEREKTQQRNRKRVPGVFWKSEPNYRLTLNIGQRISSREKAPTEVYVYYTSLLICRP